MNVCGLISLAENPLNPQTFVHVELVENPQCSPNECLLGEQNSGPKREVPEVFICSMSSTANINIGTQGVHDLVEGFEVIGLSFGSTTFIPAGL